jgi:ATP phosphoribosyltransferase
LLDAVVELMSEAGYPLEISPRNYHPRCEGIQAFLLKPRSIPQMVALELLDAGFCGRDLVLESGYDDRLEAALDLGLNRVRLVAAASDPSILDTPPKRPLVIATEFPALASRWATSRCLAHLCIHTWGSTEAWVPTYADIAVDVVETGDTMAANGLTVLEEIMTSSTVMVTRSTQGGAVRQHPLLARVAKVIG